MLHSSSNTVHITLAYASRIKLLVAESRIPPTICPNGVTYCGIELVLRKKNRYFCLRMKLGSVDFYP